MSDRVDPSQYSEAEDFYDVPAFDGTSTGDDYQVNMQSLDTQESAAFNDYRGPLDIPDIMRLYPELFLTRGGKTIKETRYRALGNGINVTGRNFLLGFAVRETAGAAAVFRLRDGMDATAPIVLPVSLAANESRSDYLPYSGGIKFRNGIYVEIVSGNIEGSLFTEVERSE